jgi:hypothetical protein
MDGMGRNGTGAFRTRNGTTLIEASYPWNAGPRRAVFRARNAGGV